jgi:hypothetical protein
LASLSAVVVLAIWIGVCVWSRHLRREPIWPGTTANALFSQRGVSGQAIENPLGSARGCLMVVVTHSDLWIAISFPFNIVLPYGLLGLEYRVPKDRVIRATPGKMLLGRVVTVEIAKPGGGSRSLQLDLSDPDAFISALRA